MDSRPSAFACYAESDSPALKIKPEDRFWIYVYGFTAFIMLVAMGVFGWLAWTSRHEPGIGNVAGQRVQTPSSSMPDEQYEILAKFRAPKYSRAASAPTDFTKAMQRYSKQDYAGAIPELRAAAQSTPNFLGTRFYLGICLLLTGDRISGIEELRGVTEAGATPFLEPARFYLAKGLIAEHDIPRAQIQLEALMAQHGEFEEQATTLLAQLRPTG